MRLPRGRYGRGTRHFPALLTKNLGVDKQVVDMMRPLFNAGVRPYRFAKFLLELHTKEHHHACLAHEHEISARRVANADCDAAPLSDFADKARWAGLVPSGKYLSAVYKEYSQSIKPHMNAEVKKRGARRCLDAASHQPLSPPLSPPLPRMRRDSESRTRAYADGRLHWDVSYKEPKHLCQYHGKALYKGLVTATNEVGEVTLTLTLTADPNR